jgi:hypothetical protein
MAVPPHRLALGAASLFSLPWPMRVALLFLAWFGSGCAQHGGRLLVVVGSDIAELSEVEVRVARVGSAPTEIRTWPLGTAEGQEMLPLSFAVQAPSDGSDVEIIVDGYPAGATPCIAPEVPPACDAPLVTRRALTGFVPNTTRVLSMFLSGRCRASEGPTCAPTETCDEGGCVDVRIDPVDLPVLTVPRGELDVGRAVDGGVPEDATLLDAADAPGLDAPGLDAPLDDAGGPLDVGTDAPLDGGTLPSMWTLHAADAEIGDEFGTTVALDFDGSRALVGAPADDTTSATDSGSVRVFDWSSTSVNETRALLPPAGAMGVAFGRALAIGGTGGACRAVVGAPSTLLSLGAAYVFECAGWTLESELPRLMGARVFGWSAAVSRSGLVAVVGAPLGSTGVGSAYAFTRTGVAWGAGVQLGPIPPIGDETGNAVAIDAMGIRALVGAPRRDLGDTDIGRAFSVDLATPGAATVVGMGGMAGVQLGMSVAISGDGTRAVVGQLDEAIVFEWTSTTWVRSSSLFMASGRVSVAMDDAGERLLVGEPDANRATLYRRASDGTWSATPAMTATPGSRFGFSVAISGDGRRALIGAPLDDTRGSDAGAAYAFILP